MRLCLFVFYYLLFISILYVVVVVGGGVVGIGIASYLYQGTNNKMIKVWSCIDSDTMSFSA